MTTRRMGRTIAVVAAAFLALLIAAPAALAKEGIETRLAAPISGDAQPGDIVPVYFTASAISETGMTPVYGTNIFFRLYGPTGAMTEATAVEQSTPGTFKVMIEIPSGGAARAEFGIHGTSPNGPSDMVWAYDGMLVSARTPPAVDPNAFQLPKPRYEPVTPVTGSGPALATDGSSTTATTPTTTTPAPAASAPFPVDPRAVGVGALAVAGLAILAGLGLRHRRHGQTSAV